MKRCPRCGHELKEDEQFCPHCGLDLRGRYRPIRKQNKPTTYLLYGIIFISLIAIPLLYSYFLNFLSNDMVKLSQEKVELPAMTEEEPNYIAGAYDSLESFHNQFSNVDSIVESIQDYEKTLSKEGTYTLNKYYEIQVLDNYDILYSFRYTFQLNENLSMTITRQFDRAHTEDNETFVLRKNNVQSYEELFLTEEELNLLESFTGQQDIISELMNDFSQREEEFNAKKETLGHYGIGSYKDQSSFVVHRNGSTYYSETTYSHTPKEYLD